MFRTDNRHCIALYFLVLLFISTSLCAQDVPGKYKKYFKQFSDNRSILEKALNLVNLTNDDVGRSFALICGVSYYPNMPVWDQNLKPAAEDVRKLKSYLETYEFYDEIVVLENGDFTIENLEYFLQTYFPNRIRQFPKSRFFFAFSGHGMAQDKKGYLLKNTARDIDDKDNSINIKILKVYLDEVMAASHHMLVMLNTCYSGTFLRRSFGGQYIPRHPGAHAITAGGSGEKAIHDGEYGSGSLFFEKMITGLKGYADDDNNGIVTSQEMYGYLLSEISQYTDQAQNPLFGDISRDGSLGAFFFLNRSRQVERGYVPQLVPESDIQFFGPDAEKLHKKAIEFYKSKQYVSALPLLQQSAQAGKPEAMFYLGFLYYKGHGVTQDYVEAVRWYRKGAEAGDAGAMSNLGAMYARGLGVTQDYSEALLWYQKGAEAENAGAMMSLGFMYSKGHGVRQDYAEAVRWYRKGAEAGDTGAMMNLGFMYSKGHGVTQDYAEAVRWYRKGAEAGHAGAMMNLGVMYSKGRGVTQDYSEALLWYRKGAEAGDAGAMINLGIMYEKGQSVTQDYLEAVRWYRKAAETGDADAMNYLGVMYYNGHGVRQDYAEAVRWYRKGAEAGNADAMANLGDMYEKGLGVTQDYAEALRLYRKAAEAGIEWAANRLKQLGE